MPSFKMQLPPRIKAILPPLEFVQDEELQWKMVDDRMTRDYVSVLLVSTLLLIIVILI